VYKHIDSLIRIIEENNEVLGLYIIDTNTTDVQHIGSSYRYHEKSDKSVAADVFEIPYLRSSIAAFGNQKEGKGAGQGFIIFFSLGNTKYIYWYGKPAACRKYGKGFDGSYIDKLKSNICGIIFYDSTERKDII
jgi:hypothetical protein